MANRVAIQKTVRHVKPLISQNNQEARSRVFGLYKAWYRQIPYIVMDYDIPKSVEQCRAKLREKFEENRHVKDIRVIDALVIKGQQELKETVNIWKQKHHLMSQYFKETQEPKPKDFLSKFLAGQ
ncbi:NADH dehydrogenase [ubiquinone] 1 alpha subcomplex subunit 6 [Amphibalanus amphitrite]|uniref:NADH dehydrogenase [ubiquinone] 1 alpha subcomplex subunit 6 n=1 Tax=Amphibalanus amphitrite TaxID=1232801 RepID=A0A6A4VYY2_AMPAM|nr:NADH dehydrogenase [ubiquinone] 1 alpha subcomplex subunit 6-like [Amphibalanus amphitrite]KAF0296784.1 NADH dehydrogenase [ubiquinone] 1 alpha subcomplex subunit 6 [Amphibalanus amphitrite]